MSPSSESHLSQLFIQRIVPLVPYLTLSGDQRLPQTCLWRHLAARSHITTSSLRQQ